MTFLSWLYLGVSWAVILAVNVFCFYRIFKKESRRPKE